MANMVLVGTNTGANGHETCTKSLSSAPTSNGAVLFDVFIRWTGFIYPVSSFDSGSIRFMSSTGSSSC